MLSVTRRGEVRDVAPLTEEEDRALRVAFGRRSDFARRKEGAAVVLHYQRRAGGCWILCDCLGSVARPPVLIPVAESHVRRHNDATWPEHHGECDFYREASEQRTITASYSGPLSARPLGLMARLRDEPMPYVGEPGGRDYGQSRSALATLLMTLVASAGLNMIGPGWEIDPVRSQYARLRGAAGTVELEKGVPLARYLCTYPPALRELVDKISAAPAEAFPGSGRPHGLLLGVYTDASKGQIHPLQGPPLPVRGAIAVFGEVDGHSDRTTDERRARAPYLGIALIGKSGEGDGVEVLEAYLHPVVSASHLMPVDSNLERLTLEQIKTLASWLIRKNAIALSVEKPLFDVTAAGPARGAQAPADDAEGGEAREPCVPDFIVRRETAKPGAGVVIVETMGYANPVYRARKHRTHAAMQGAFGGAPLVQHDFHEPANLEQKDRDGLFWQALRAAVVR